MDAKEALKIVEKNIHLYSKQEISPLLELLDRKGIDLGKNIVVCVACLELLESNFGHDFKTCNCPNKTFVDGGREPGNGRMGGRNMSLVRHFSSTTTALKYVEYLKESRKL